MKGFRQFVIRGNLVDLAVAVVIGTQFSNLVKQFVASFISPLLSLVGGQPDLTGYSFTIHKAKFTYGAFLTELIAFVMAAAVVYFVIVMPVELTSAGSWPVAVETRFCTSTAAMSRL